MELNELQQDCARRQKKGLHFILSSVVIWGLILGAHLLPFSWLYQSRSYLVLSVVIPILSLAVGLMFLPFVLAAVMVFVEGLFAFLLYRECKRM